MIKLDKRVYLVVYCKKITKEKLKIKIGNLLLF